MLGAGGGLELKALAEAEPRWTFVGVDPAPAMLKLAEQTLGPFNARVQLQQGYIDDAPDGPFDAATCLLTLHFLDADERRRTAREIHRRLGPAHPLSPPTPVFRNKPPSARDGCRAMRPMRSPPAPIPTRPTMRVPRSMQT